jgi:hypothetical protein
MQARAGEERYVGPLRTGVAIVRAEGTRALWQGLVPTLLRQMSSVCIRFTCYGAAMAALQREGQARPYWHSFVAGASCGFMNVVLNQPLDVVKTKLQNQSQNAPQYRGMFHCMKVTVGQHGGSALWAGAVPRMCRQLPAQAITFGLFNVFCKVIERGHV